MFGKQSTCKFHENSFFDLPRSRILGFRTRAIQKRYTVTLSTQVIKRKHHVNYQSSYLLLLQSSVSVHHSIEHLFLQLVYRIQVEMIQ